MILFHFFWLAHSTSIQSKIHALCTIRWISKPLKQSAVIWFGQSPVCDFHFISPIKRLNGKTIVSVFGFVFVSNVSYVYTILAHKHTHSEQIHCNGIKINVYEYVCWCACVRLDYTLDCRMSFRCKKKLRKKFVSHFRCDNFPSLSFSAIKKGERERETLNQLKRKIIADKRKCSEREMYE